MHLARIFARPLSVTVVAILAAGLLPLAAGTAAADSKPTNPDDPRTPTTVTADPLPTVQIDGVAWDQVVVGNTVYVVGRFSTARPAGASPGTGTTTRSNMLAYDINTGTLRTDFVADLNAEARSVAASPDGRRVYIAGSFTSVNGQPRSRAAAFDTATGALDPSFKPAFNGQTRAVVVSSTRVYYGGNYSNVGSTPRVRLASLDPRTGAVQSDFNASASLRVNDMVLAPGGQKLVVAGGFEYLNQTRVRGLGALAATSGVSVTWTTSDTVYGYGDKASMLSLEADGDSVYGTAFNFGGTGNFEGAFRASADDGRLLWLEDCHGDTYSVHAASRVVYTAGHPHTCATVGGFPEVSPRVSYRAVAFSRATTGTVRRNTAGGYANFEGQPAPSVQNWFPDFAVGTFTGQSQGPWSVDGNADYVLYAGEFPRVNGKAQQGLVRFANVDRAPNKVGPVTDAKFVATATASALPGRATVRWTSTYDNDNSSLTYSIFRDGVRIATVAGDSTLWSRPTLSFNDVAASAGNRTYRVTATDAFGNAANAPDVTVTVR